MEFPEDVRKFLKEPNFMFLSEFSPDRTIHSTIVWYEFNSKKGVFRFSTTGDRVKYRNLTKDPRCTFVIPNTKNMYQYVQVQGKVADYTRKNGHDFIDSEAKRYLNKDKYPYDPERKEDRVTFTIKPERLFTSGFKSSRS